MAPLESLLEEARKRLVETGTRNRLIHVNRNAKRANVVNVINERSDDLFNLLRLQSKKMRFAGNGKESDEVNSDVTFEHEGQFDETRYTDLVIETPLTPDALQKRLLKIASDSRTAEEEQGINILYLNLGFLRWYEDKNSEVLRESPLILLPVELVRNEKTSTFDLKCRDDDIMTNLPLQERLRTDFGIVLPEIDDSEDWVPTGYLSAVQEAVSNRERWSIDPDGIQLGFFSFAKLLMLRDLDPVNWSEGTLLNNPIIKGLLAEGFTKEPPLFDSDTKLDEELSPQDILQVVDADASQTKVIQEVRSGRNLVVQGPPGTGKSQTITNILAAAAHDNKRVLFVAEKMAALEVVHRRMVKSGLKDLCLELHSRTANKRAFLEEIAETLSNGRSAEKVLDNTNDLLSARNELNKVAKLLHSKVDSVNRSPFEVLSNLINFSGQQVNPPMTDLSHLVNLSPEKESTLCEQLQKFCEILTKHGPEQNHPFRGVTNLDLQPTDLLRLENHLQNLRDALHRSLTVSAEIAQILSVEPARTLDHLKQQFETVASLTDAPTSAEQFTKLCYDNLDDPRFQEALEIATDWCEIKEELGASFNQIAWTQQVSHLRPILMKGVQSWFSRVFGNYRSASKELASILSAPIPQSPDGRLALLDSLINAQSKLELYEQEKTFLESTLGKFWRNERSSFSEMSSCAKWLVTNKELLGQFSSDDLGSLIRNEKLKGVSLSQLDALDQDVRDRFSVAQNLLQIEEFMSDQIPSMNLECAMDRIDEMLQSPNLYDAWVTYSMIKTELDAQSLGDLIPIAEQNSSAPQVVLTEFLYGLNESRWHQIRKDRPELNQVSKSDRHELVKRFQKLESERTKETQRVIRSHHLTNIPQGSVGEMGVIRGEIAKKRRHYSIRKVMSLAGSVVQRIKPIFLMSPISVAQFLPPEKIEFDLLVIDEASQVRPEDALGLNRPGFFGDL